MHPGATLILSLLRGARLNGVCVTGNSSSTCRTRGIADERCRTCCVCCGSTSSSARDGTLSLPAMPARLWAHLVLLVARFMVSAQISCCTGLHRQPAHSPKGSRMARRMPTSAMLPVLYRPHFARMASNGTVTLTSGPQASDRTGCPFQKLCSAFCEKTMC